MSNKSVHQIEISASRRDISHFTVQLPATLTSAYTHDAYQTLRQALGQICASYLSD